MQFQSSHCRCEKVRKQIIVIPTFFKCQKSKKFTALKDVEDLFIKSLISLTQWLLFPNQVSQRIDCLSNPILFNFDIFPLINPACYFQQHLPRASRKLSLCLALLSPNFLTCPRVTKQTLFYSLIISFTHLQSIFTCFA